MSTNTEGWPLPIVITTNFTCLEKVDNKSNHYFWKCNFSGNTKGSHQEKKDFTIYANVPL